MQSETEQYPFSGFSILLLEILQNRSISAHSDVGVFDCAERDVDELVEYVEEERRLQERREERRDAPAWTRAKWWLFGRSREESD